MRQSAWLWMTAAAIRCVGLAQEPSSGLIRGDLLARSGTDERGEFVLRDAENRVYQCSYDEQSSFERANQPIRAGTMARGDHLEVVSGRKPDSGICYARAVDVEGGSGAKAQAIRRPAHTSSYGAGLVDLLAPRGNLTLAGVVLRVSGDELLLRTRSNERKVILLRSDTRYLGDGQFLDRLNLLVNTRVYIRAGRNWNDQVEAYQVVWGDILEPVSPPRIVP